MANAGASRPHLVESLRKTLPLWAWALALFYAALVGYWFIALRPMYPALAWTWGTAALAAVGIGLLCQRIGPDAPSLNFASAALAAIVVCASGVLILETGNPSLTLAQYVVVLGFGLLLISRAVLLLTALGALAFWAVAAAHWGGTEWTPRGIALVAVSIVAFLAQSMRLRLHDQLALSHDARLAAEVETQREHRLREEAEATSRFLRLAAHEIGTPLTPITLQAHRIAQAPLPDELRRAAKMLERNVTRLNTVVADILLLTRHQAGVLEVEQKPVDLVAVAHAEVETARPAAKAAGVEMVENSGAAAAALGDAAKLGLALRKLIDNAVRYSPRGSTVEVAVQSHGGDILVDVVDQGPGVPEEKRATLFQPFGAIRDPMAAQGLGLGLAVASAIVTRHGGALSYRAGTQGSVFTLTLPELKS